MKAVQINEYGGPDVLRLTDDAPKPHPEPGQVLVEVYAASVNPFDWKVREGYMQQMAALEFPATLGGDCAGVIAEVGEGVTGLKVGDEVYGQANALSGHGSYAEFTPVKVESVGPKPKSVDFITAAALPLVGVSAYQALVDHMDLNKGQKILIHGGAGGIASMAIPLAKHLGAYVASTAAANDLEYVKSLGADQVIDYKAESFEHILKDFDAVYDTVGGETYLKSFQILKPGGKVVSMVEQPNQEQADKFKAEAIHQFTQQTPARLAALAQLVDEGVIKPVIDKTFPLAEAAQAQAYIQAGKQHGKVVLVVKE